MMIAYLINLVNALSPRMRLVVDAMPMMLRTLLLELTHNIESDVQLAVALVLGMAGNACAGSMWIRCPNGALVPPTLFLVAVAEPGGGKSALLNALLKPFLDFHAEAHLSASASEAQTTVRGYAKAAQTRVLKKQIDQLVEELLAIGEAECEHKQRSFRGEVTPYMRSARPARLERRTQAQAELQVVEQSLAEHLDAIKASKATKTPEVVQEDVSLPGLKSFLAKVSSTVGLVFREGGKFFGSPISRAFYDLSDIYDGQGPRVLRKGSGFEAVRHAFVNLVVATQAEPLAAFLHKNLMKAIESGWISRVQIVTVPSVRDKRTNAPRPILDTAQQAWGCWVKSQLDENRQNAAREDFQPAAVGFEPAAVDLYWARVEQLQAEVKSKRFAGDEAYATRLPELWCRVAGIFHRVARSEGEITAGTLFAGMTVCEWLTEHHLAAVVPLPERTKSERNVEKVHAEFVATVQSTGQTVYLKRDLIALAPNLGMTEREMKQTLDILCHLRRAWVRKYNGKDCIELNSWHYPTFSPRFAS